MIAIACVIGTLVPQGGDVSGFLRAHPSAVGWMQPADRAGLTHVFTS
jgi:hypothetical protein